MLSQLESMWKVTLAASHCRNARLSYHTSTTTVHSAPYQAGPKTRELEMAEIDKMLATNIVKFAETEWAAPIVFVKTKNRTLRFCFIYRKLYAVAKMESY